MLTNSLIIQTQGAPQEWLSQWSTLKGHSPRPWPGVPKAHARFRSQSLQHQLLVIDLGGIPRFIASGLGPLPMKSTNISEAIPLLFLTFGEELGEL